MGLKQFLCEDDPKYHDCVKSMLESNIQSRGGLLVFGKKRAELNRWKGVAERYEAGTETREDAEVISAGMLEMAKGLSGTVTPATMMVYADTTITVGKIKVFLSDDGK